MAKRAAAKTPPPPAKEEPKAPTGGGGSGGGGQVIKVISAKALTVLLKNSRSTAAEVASLTGTMREKIAYAKEKQNLHTGAFAVIKKLDKMEPEALRLFMDHFDHMFEISGLRARAESVHPMDFQEDEGSAEDEEPAKEPPTNVKPFPTPGSVAAE